MPVFVPFAALALTAGLQGPLDSLPDAKLTLDRSRKEITIELPPVDLPAGHGPDDPAMVDPPVCKVVVPINASIVAYRVEVVDSAGRRMPQSMLHHFNLTDPSRRELFLPISLHLLAASKETQSIAIPWFFIGMPLEQGRPLVTSGMVANQGGQPVRQVRLRLILHYVPSSRPWPLYQAYPWVMDVMFPLGAPGTGIKGFDLPPGPSEHSWEASPAVPGQIIGLSGHVHDYAKFVELTDLTTRQVIWHAEPVKDSAGIVYSLPVTRFYRWYRLGVHIEPAHRYRVRVAYDNPTGRILPMGGMGAVAGLFVPDHAAVWPLVNQTDTLYQKDLEIALRWGGSQMMMMGHNHH